MILLHGTIFIKPQMRDRVLEGVRKLVRASVAEVGVIAYQISADVDDRDKLHFTEVYRDETSLRAHACTAHVRDFIEFTMPLFEISNRIMFAGDMQPYEMQNN